MVTIRISEECGDVLRKLAEKARRSLCKQVEAMIMSQNDIDSILEREIGKLVTNVESKQGKPSILLGTIK